MITIRIVGPKAEVAKAAATFGSIYRTGGKVVRQYAAPVARADLPKDADVIIITEETPT